jgi:Leucine-rich repeat (LRR) protein
VHQKLQRELEQYSKLLQDQRLDVVRRTLEHLEEIGGRLPAFIGWLIGEVDINNRNQLVFNGPFSLSFHRAYIHLWMLGWLAKQGHLRLRKITELDLRDIGLIEFPPMIKFLSNLRRVRLEKNPVYSIWESIEQVTIDQNQIHRFAWIVKKMENSPDFIVDFSDYMGDETIMWSSLQELPNIISINFSNPSIIELPDWLRGIKTIQNLTLNGSRIQKIPKWIVEFTHLQVLEIGNQYSVDKFEFPKEMSGLTSLRYLSIQNLGLYEVPKWLRSMTKLEVLCLDGNNLQELPIWLQELQELRVLWVTGNPLDSCVETLLSIPNLEEVALNFFPDRNGVCQRDIAIELHGKRPEILIRRQCKRSNSFPFN